MADFEISIDDLTNSQTAISAIKNSYYPNNQQVIKSTSYSEDPENYGRNLMSRDPVKVLQGDALYRNPAFALAGYEQNARSTMHTILSMGSDIDDSVQIVDPEDSSKYLTGAQARMEIARKSLMTTGFAPGGFEGAMNAFSSTNTAGLKSSDIGSGSSMVGGTDGSSNGIPHGTKGYETSDSAQVFNGGNRPIAILDELTEPEKNIYKQKNKDLLNKANFKCNDYTTLNGSTVNFNVNPKGQDLSKLNFDILMSGSYIEKDGQFEYQTAKLDKALIGIGEKTVMPSAALIELLSRLTDKVYIRGGFGKGRGIIGPNFSFLTASNNSVTDHAFVRGFDIRQVGDISFDSGYDSKTYLKGLDQLLTYIESLPQELHPDLIGVSIDLGNILGITDSLESANAPFRKKHPNLAKFVNLAADPNHKDHIHISFGAKRAGVFFVGSTQGDVSSAGISTEPFGPQVANPQTLASKFKKSFYKPTSPFGEGSLTPMEMFYLLNYYGNFGEELSAIFTEMARRESRYNPWSTNDSGYMGLLQTGTRIKSGDTGGADVVEFIDEKGNKEKVRVWKMAYTPWKKNKLTQETADQWIINVQKNDPNAGRQFYDKRMFIPINQITLLRAKFSRPNLNDKIVYIGSNRGNSCLAPWGDGFLEHGWISGLKYENVRQIYTKATGKNADLLDKWILKYTNKDSDTRKIDPENNKQKLENWVKNKKYYPINYTSKG